MGLGYVLVSIYLRRVQRLSCRTQFFHLAYMYCFSRVFFEPFHCLFKPFLYRGGFEFEVVDGVGVVELAFSDASASCVAFHRCFLGCGEFFEYVDDLVDAGLFVAAEVVEFAWWVLFDD